MHVGRQVKLLPKRNVPRHLLAKHGKLKALQVYCQHIWGLLNLGGALGAYELLVQGAAVPVVAIQHFSGGELMQRLMQALAPAPYCQLLTRRRFDRYQSQPPHRHRLLNSRYDSVKSG